jgi:hypothetical protein
MHAALHRLLHVTLYNAYWLAVWCRRSTLKLLLLALDQDIGRFFMHGVGWGVKVSLGLSDAEFGQISAPKTLPDRTGGGYMAFFVQQC